MASIDLFEVYQRCKAKHEQNKDKINKTPDYLVPIAYPQVVYSYLREGFIVGFLSGILSTCIVFGIYKTL